MRPTLANHFPISVSIICALGLVSVTAVAAPVLHDAEVQPAPPSIGADVPVIAQILAHDFASLALCCSSLLGASPVNGCCKS